MVAKDPNDEIPQTEAALPPVKPPREGGREASGSQFLNFTPGQAIEGLLIGTTPVRNQRGEEVDRYVLIDGKGDTSILPDHVDLTRRLADVILKTGWGAQVWIRYRGKVDIPGVANPMAQYQVQDYGLSEAGKVMAGRFKHARAVSSEEEM